MPKLRIQDRVQSLPLYYKLVGAGALITLIGAFLPWYNDIDRFQKGVQFAGVTGPLYLVGYIMIALSIFAIILTAFHTFDRKIPALPLKESQIFIIGASFELFLLVLTNSVFFHPDFGMNVVDKASQYGMIISFIGVISVLAGGIIQSKERGTSRMIKEFQDEALGIEEEEDDDIELNNFQKEIEEEHSYIQEKSRKPMHQHSGERVYKAKPQEEEQIIEKNIPVREARAINETPYHESTTPRQTTVRREPFPDPNLIKKVTEKAAARPVFGGGTDKKPEPKDQDINPNTVIRMDL